jgi:hypothetical protein
VWKNYINQRLVNLKGVLFRLDILRLCMPGTFVKLVFGMALLYILCYLNSLCLGELSSDLRSAERAVGRAYDIRAN